MLKDFAKGLGLVLCIVIMIFMWQMVNHYGRQFAHREISYSFGPGGVCYETTKLEYWKGTRFVTEIMTIPTNR